jgi:hypothetical protein
MVFVSVKFAYTAGIQMTDRMDHNKISTTVADLLTDDTFLHWYFKAGCTHWDGWIAKNRQHIVLAGCAVRILSSITDVETDSAATESATRSFDRLVEKMRRTGIFQQSFKTK